MACPCIWCCAERGDKVQIPTMLCSAGDDQPVGEYPDVTIPAAELADLRAENERLRRQLDRYRALDNRSGW